MSIIEHANNANTNRGNTGSTKAPSQYDGAWLNIGVYVDGDEGSEDPRFVRLNRGIPVADLQPRKIYETTNPDSLVLNEMIAAIQQKSLDLEPGQSAKVNMSIELYMRNDEIDVDSADNGEGTKVMANLLFGSTEKPAKGKKAA